MDHTPIPGGPTAHTLASLLSRPRLQIGLVVVSLGVLLLWAFSQVFISPASRTCFDLYHSARTAADTLHVDSIIPGPRETRTPEARTCGSIREFARWF